MLQHCELSDLYVDYFIRVTILYHLMWIQKYIDIASVGKVLTLQTRGPSLMHRTPTTHASFELRQENKKMSSRIVFLS